MMLDLFLSLLSSNQIVLAEPVFRALVEMIEHRHHEQDYYYHNEYRQGVKRPSAGADLERVEC